MYGINENSMVVYTCFNSNSFNHYSPSVLKSGICKYARRGEHDKLEWCIIEMALFSLCEKGKPLITNLINRTKILLMEDISFININIICECILLINQYQEDIHNYNLLINICKLLKNTTKNRMTSYVNNWWKHKHTQKDILNLKLDKINKYKKKNDSEELLILGENLIQYLDTKDEKMFSIFNHIIKLKDNQGLRYSRREASYLWFEIIYDYIQDYSKLQIVFDFALTMYKRRNMKERYYFAIWLGLIVWKMDDINMDDISNDYMNIDLTEYFKSRKYLKIDDYVINDYHVNKSFGLDHFAKNGAYVKDEDLSILDKGDTYKKYYMYCKKSDVNSNKTDISYIYEYIHWNSFTDVDVLEEGVCGGKVCCIKVKLNNKYYILKEMKKSMNYGVDYYLIDKCKKIFNLIDLNMKLIESNVGLGKIDATKKSYVNNWDFVNKDTKYCMMDYKDNIGDVGKNKDILNDNLLKYECLKIRLFDGIFRSSDNILRNILITRDNALISIDEGDIYGKRVNIFNKNDWCKDNISIDIYNKVIDDLLSDADYKCKYIVNIMKNLHYNHHINEFECRFNNYKSIVLNEITNQ